MTNSNGGAPLTAQAQAKIEAAYAAIKTAQDVIDTSTAVLNRRNETVPTAPTIETVPDQTPVVDEFSARVIAAMHAIEGQTAPSATETAPSAPTASAPVSDTAPVSAPRDAAPKASKKSKKLTPDKDGKHYARLAEYQQIVRDTAPFDRKGQLLLNDDDVFPGSVYFNPTICAAVMGHFESYRVGGTVGDTTYKGLTAAGEINDDGEFSGGSEKARMIVRFWQASQA